MPTSILPTRVPTRPDDDRPRAGQPRLAASLSGRTHARRRAGRLTPRVRPAARGLALALPWLLAACATTSLPPSPQYQRSTAATEAEYQSYLIAGTGILQGQALQLLVDGRRAPVAGRSVTLDPATTTGNDWWRVAGRSWADRLSQPPSEGFAKARRTALTDAEGRFVFRNLPAGSYLLRTDFGGAPANAPKGLLGRRITVPTTGPIVLDDLTN